MKHGGTTNWPWISADHHQTIIAATLSEVLLNVSIMNITIQLIGLCLNANTYIDVNWIIS